MPDDDWETKLREAIAKAQDEYVDGMADVAARKHLLKASKHLLEIARSEGYIDPRLALRWLDLAQKMLTSGNVILATAEHEKATEKEPPNA